MGTQEQGGLLQGGPPAALEFPRPRQGGLLSLDFTVISMALRERTFMRFQKGLYIFRFCGIVLVEGDVKDCLARQH